MQNAPVDVDSLVGSTLGDYQIGRLLGRGKLSIVYKARSLSQGYPAMVTMFQVPEIIPPQVYERFRVRFLTEGMALIKLRHPHILPVYTAGEWGRTLYLVTAYLKGISLAQTLKRAPQQPARFTPGQALAILKQVSAGLDEAHRQGFVHGILSPSNVLITDHRIAMVTGFGLLRMLELYGLHTVNPPHAHLYSIAGTFLGLPEYVAPECVQNLQVDARADIYSTGLILYELLSGALPFTGDKPVEIAEQRLHQPVPTLHARYPEIPAGLDLVIGKALQRDPSERYQWASELTTAFEHALRIQESSGQSPIAQVQSASSDPQMTIPPTIDWFQEEAMETGKWQLMPPIATGQLPSMAMSVAETKTLVPDVPETPGELRESANWQQSLTVPASDDDDSKLGVDPFAWWSASGGASTLEAPDMPMRRSTGKLAGSMPSTRQRRKRASRPGRRRVVALLATGGVVGVLGISGVALARTLGQHQNPQAQTTTTTANNPSMPTKGSQQKPTAGTTAKPKPAPTKATQPTQAPTPKPQPTQPQHTGTVIGSTNQPNNTAQPFTNPADGRQGLLIRLPNGQFVACERACTHQGIAVNYDGNIKQLVCPLHGAMFDPANGFNVTQGPATTALPKVTVRMNPDGTVTTG